MDFALELSSQILGLLMMMQNDQSAAQATTGSTSTSSSSSSDPLTNLVLAIDTDGNGSITQSEMETYITSLGGTTDEADAEFAAYDLKYSRHDDEHHYLRL